MERIKKFFKIEERGTTVRSEIIGGIVTFLAMAYILVVNPGMMAEAGIPYGGAFVATAVGAAVATLVMGLYAKYPIALAPGMGVNAFFTYTVVLGFGYSWQEALAASFIGGVIFLVVSLTKFRTYLINAIPNGLKYAIGAGIGFFIAFIGLANAGIIVSDAFAVPTDDGILVISNTLVTLGDFTNPTVLLSLFGIILVFVLYGLRHKISNFALIIAILGTAVVGLIIGYVFGVPGMPAWGTFNYSDLGDISQTFGAFVGGFSGLARWDLLFIVFSFLFLDIFDTAGTFISVARPAGLMGEDGKVEGVEKAFVADAVGTLISSTLGTSEITSYIESGAGIEAGARTGLSSVVVGVLFLLSLVAFPLFSIFTHPAVTSMALVLVGVFMMEQLRHIEWDDKAILVSAFITILTTVLTYSIGDGIAFGILAYVIVMLAQGRRKELNLLLYLLSVAFIVYFAASAIWG